MNATNLPQGSVAAVLAAARSQIGVPYHWAWEKPGEGFDCSGLTQWAYGQAGIKLQRVTVLQVTQGIKVPRDQLMPGDLVFPEFPIHHVQIYSGNGNIIEAPETGKNVREIPMWGFYTARRVMADTGGDGSSGGTQGLLGIPNTPGIGTAISLIPGFPNFNDLIAKSRGFMLRVIEVSIGFALISVAINKITGFDAGGKVAKLAGAAAKGAIA